MVVFIWILSLTNLDSTQYRFKGTYAECQMEAHQIMQEDTTKKAGCYKVSNIPPYLKKKYDTRIYD